MPVFGKNIVPSEHGAQVSGMRTDETEIGVEHKKPAFHMTSPKIELRDYKKVTTCIAQDALDLWAELWSELQGKENVNDQDLTAGDREFRPSCGMPQFLDKMWLLKHYLEFIKRYSQQNHGPDNPCG